MQGCAKGIHGTVYLDANANNKKDDSETTLLAGVTFTVTKDGEEIDDGVTDSTGAYEADMEGSGEYCVIITQSDLLSPDASRVTALSKPVQMIRETAIRFARYLKQKLGFSEALAQTAVAEICTDGSDNDDDGLTDCLDTTDCSADTSCKEAGKCTDSIDNDKDGKTDCDDNDCSTDTTCDDSATTTPPKVENGKVCQTPKGLELELDVPIATDYKGLIDGIDDETLNVSNDSGSNSITMEIKYPESCTLLALTLPEYLIPVLTADLAEYDSATHRINLEAALVDDTCSEGDIININEDVLRVCDLPLEVDSTLTFGDQEDTITPSVVCPDKSDTTVLLQKFTLSVEGSNDISIAPVASTSSGNSGDVVTVATTITNNTSLDLSATLTTTVTSTATGISYDVSPSTAGSCTGTTTGSCDFDLTTTAVVVTATFTLPTVTTSTNLTYTTSLSATANGDSGLFTGSSVSITVEP